MGIHWKVESSLHLRWASFVSFRPRRVASTSLPNPNPNGTQGSHWTCMCFKLAFQPAQHRRGRGRLSPKESKGFIHSLCLKSSSHSVTQAMGPTWLQFEKMPHPIWWFHLSDWRALRRSGVLSQNRPAVGRRDASAVTWNKSNRRLHLQLAGVDSDSRGLQARPRAQGAALIPCRAASYSLKWEDWVFEFLPAGTMIIYSYQLFIS